MTDQERILKLRKTASDLGIRIHLASMNFSDKPEVEATKARDVYGIVFIDNAVNNETALHIQQHRYGDDGRAE